MQKIFLFLLGVLCCFVVSFDIASAAVFAKQTMGMDLYEKLRTFPAQEETVALRRSSKSLGLTGQEILAIESGENISSELRKKVNHICPGVTEEFQAQFSCQNRIRKYVDMERLIAAQELRLIRTSKSSEMFSNGTLADSPFDTVVDLNTIDVLLFGLDADLPTFRWGAPADEDIIPLSELQGGNEGQSSSPSQEGSLNGADPSNSSQETNTSTGASGTETNPETISQKDSTDFLTTIPVVQQCVDPYNVYFTDTLISSGSSDVPSVATEEVSTFAGTTFFDDMGTSGAYDVPLEGTTYSQENFSDEEKAEDECEEYIFGKFICMDDWNRVVKKNKNCDPDDIICIIISFKTSERNLLGSGFTPDCVNCLVEKMNKMLIALGESVAPPCFNTNTQGITCTLSLFRLPSKMFHYITGGKTGKDSNNEGATEKERKKSLKKMESDISLCVDVDKTMRMKEKYLPKTDSSAQVFDNIAGSTGEMTKEKKKCLDDVAAKTEISRNHDRWENLYQRLNAFRRNFEIALESVLKLSVERAVETSSRATNPS